jgi:hypothetical protein
MLVPDCSIVLRTISYWHTSHRMTISFNYIKLPYVRNIIAGTWNWNYSITMYIHISRNRQWPPEHLLRTRTEWYIDDILWHPIGKQSPIVIRQSLHKHQAFWPLSGDMNSVIHWPSVAESSKRERNTHAVYANKQQVFGFNNIARHPCTCHREFAFCADNGSSWARRTNSGIALEHRIYTLPLLQ